MITYLMTLSLMISTDNTSSSIVHKVKNWDKYIEDWNMFDHYQWKKSDEK